MYRDNIDYRDVLAKADAYKTTGETRIHLFNAEVYPWHLVTKVDPGGSHRLDIATSVRITAVDPATQIEFSWSFDIEDQSANGKGSYQINIGACREVMGKVPAAARQALREYFATCAGKVQEKAQEWQAIADRQRRDADALHSLAVLKD
jgi:hypothetical protein